MSFPTRERGLKFRFIFQGYIACYVVPHAGTWIEIKRKWRLHQLQQVVPHAGTWIEINTL